MRQTRPKRGGGQTWKTFLRHHAAELWAGDFLQVTDLFFRPLFAFFNTLAEVTQGGSMYMERALPPISGWRNNCGRRLPMGKPPNI
jgi:hypothetical protein